MKIGKILNNNVVVVYEENEPEKIIEYAKTKASKVLNDFIYITLPDHIHMAILREKEGISTKNIMLWDIKRFYKAEFEIGFHALKFIEEKFQMKLSEDEAGFIALHIVNAQIDSNYNAIKEIGSVTKLIHQIIKILKYHFHSDFDEESVYFYRFITHLNFFALRVFQKNNNNQHDEDEELLALVKSKYKSSYSSY